MWAEVPNAPTRVTVTCDDREVASGLVEEIAARWSPTYVGRLAVGDVEVGPRLVVERKTPRDLVASLLDGRLLDQAAALARIAEPPLLVVEGTDAIDPSRIPPRQLRGALLSLVVAFRIPLLRTGSPAETATFVAQAAAQESRRLAARSSQPLPRNARRVSMEMLAAIPGIGDERARRLLDRFGSVRAVVEAETERLTETPGVGRSTARSIRRALDQQAADAAR